MSEPFRFFSLPFEIRAIIWKHAVPQRIVEFGQPNDPDIPIGDLKRSWVLNRAPPNVAQICKESRDVALKMVHGMKYDVGRLQSSDNGRLQSSDNGSLQDIRCWLESTKILHFNAPDENATQEEQRKLVERLMSLSEAAYFDKKVSVSADIFHPFIRFHRRTEMDDDVRWRSIFRLSEFIVSLHTVSIKATKEQARSMGLFSDEPAQLVNPFDLQAIKRYRNLWELTQDSDPTAQKFFDTVNTDRFNFRVHRWMAEMETHFIVWRYNPNPFSNSGAGQAMLMLTRDISQRSNPIVRQYLSDFPKMHLRIMFRICPPEG